MQVGRRILHKNKGFHPGYRRDRVLNLSKEERAIYEGRLDWLRMEISALEKAEEKGMAKGMAKGIAENSLHIAKNMLAKNLDLHLIAEITGLSLEEVMALKKELEAR